MRKKVKFDRWVAIVYNTIKKHTVNGVHHEPEKLESKLKLHHNYCISKNAKDIAVRVNQLLSAKSNVEYKIGNVKSKKKRVIKV